MHHTYNMTAVKKCSLLFLIVLTSCRFFCISEESLCEYKDGYSLGTIQLADSELRLIAIGDFGRGDSGQMAVASRMALYHQADPVDMVLLAGDNFYETGVISTEDPLFDLYFREIYSTDILDLPFYVVLGNHDHYGNAEAQINYVDPDGRWTIPSLYYTLSYELSDGSTVDFFMIDSYVLEKNDAIANAEIEWLTTRLKLSDSDMKIVMGHHPLFSSGAHGDSLILQGLLLDLFLENNVNLYISGHDHHLEIFSENQGFRQIVTGAASDNLREVADIPNTWSQSILGFVALEFRAGSYSIEAVDSAGNLLYSETTTLTSSN